MSSGASHLSALSTWLYSCARSGRGGLVNAKPRVAIVRARAIDRAVNKVADGLSTHGYATTLLVWDRGRNVQTEENAHYTTRAFRMKAPYDKVTVFPYLPVWWLYELYFLWKGRYDIMHVCDLDTLFPAIVAKLIRRNKLCYHIYDFYADNLPNGRFTLVRRAIRGIIASIERACVAFADVLFLVDESRLEEVRGARLPRVFYLYNSPRDLPQENKAVPIKRSDQSLLIFYAGVTEPKRGIEFLLRAVCEVDRVRVVLAGALTDDRFLARIRENAARVQYIGWLHSYDEVLRWTLAADALFRFSDPTWPKTKYESPNKLFEAMMCGKPIIVSDQSRMADIVREEQCGIIVTYGNVEAIKAAIEAIRDNEHLRAKLGENGRRAYEERYNWGIMEARLLAAYRGLC